MSLGEQIRAAREEKGISQEELAERLGVSRQAVSKWENGTAVPQGANRDRLAEVLGVEPERTEKRKGNFLGWLGWALAAVLLVCLAGLRGTGKAAPETAAEPTLHSVRFYSGSQEEVLPQADWYNAAEIESILIQWTGDRPPETVSMFYTAAGTDTVERAELAAVRVPGDAGNALLLSADALHREGLAGQLYFELRFGDGATLSTYDPYHMFNVLFDDSASVLAYVESFDGEELAFDRVEWVEVPSQRAQELGITDPGGGFFLYNAREETERLPAAEDGTYTLLDWAENYAPKDVSAGEFRAALAEREGVRVPYELTIEGGQITQVREHYVP